MDRQLEPVIDEFLTGIDGAEDLGPDLLRSLHLASDLVGPVMRNVAIRAARAHPRAVGEVDRRLQFGKYVLAHLVTTGAEFFRIGQFQRGIEGAPKHYAGHEAGKHQHAETEYRTRPPQHVPQFDGKRPKPCQPGPARYDRVGRAHRRPPGAARLSIVSISMKSLSTGGFTRFCETWHSVQKKRRGDTEARNCPSRSMK